MNVALAVHHGTPFDSVRQIARNLTDILSREHRLQQLNCSPADPFTEADSLRVADIVTTSDVLVGFHSVLLPLLTARTRLGIHRPCAVFVLGAFPRGAGTIRQLVPHLSGEDVLIANCAADVALIRKFLPDVRVELMPFAVDSAFYPLPEGDRRAARAMLGLSEGSPVLLYAGRITLEKNLHTTLKVFAAINHHLPDAHLLLAGPIQDVPFFELGITPLQYARTVDKVIRSLRLAPGQIRYLGRVEPERLRSLYNAANAVINMTLHHDENFGFGQIEAMACGTPVIGTAWGGLRDTVRDGVTGYQVGVTVSPLGVKANWWSAINKTLRLLTLDAKQGRFNRTTLHRMSAEYAPSHFRERLLALLQSLAHQGTVAKRPLAVTSFGQEFWDVCNSDHYWHARYTPGTNSFRLYRGLIEAYAGLASDYLPADAPLRPDDVLSLAMPTTFVDRATLAVNDPLYPFACRVPEAFRPVVHLILRSMTSEPVTTVSRLRQAHLSGHALAADAIAWMSWLGLVLRSPHDASWIAPSSIGRQMSESPFVIQRIDRSSSDLLVFEG